MTYSIDAVSAYVLAKEDEIERLRRINHRLILELHNRLLGMGLSEEVVSDVIKSIVWSAEIS
jgi:vacuolar-type H+-ATPase subunit C/Vma6